MDGSLLLGAISGLVGTVIITILSYFLNIAGHTLDLPYLLGARFVDIKDKAKVYTAGLLLHLLAGAAWGAMYILTITAMGIQANWPAGILWGFAHGIFVGVMLGLLSDDHPHIGEGKLIDDPGIMGRRWSPLMPYWILGLHVIFGVVTLFTYRFLFTP